MFTIKVTDHDGIERFVRNAITEKPLRYATRPPAERDAEELRKISSDEWKSIDVVPLPRGQE